MKRAIRALTLCCGIGLLSLAALGDTLTWAGGAVGDWDATTFNWQTAGGSATAWVAGSVANIPSAATITVKGTVSVGGFDFGASAVEKKVTGGTVDLVSPATIVGRGGVIASALTGTDGLLADFPCDISCAGFIPVSAPALVLKGRNISEITSETLSGDVHGGFVSRKNAVVCYVRAATEGTGVDAQFQVLDGTRVKCVKVNFTQIGSDVYAQSVKAGIIDASAAGGIDLEDPSARWSGATPVDSVSGSGYGVRDIALALEGDRRLILSGDWGVSGACVVDNLEVVFNTRSVVNLPNAISGSGSLVLQGSVPQIVDYSTWVTKDAAVVLHDANLDEVRLVSAKMGGGSVNEKGATARVFRTTRSGMTMTCQVQLLDHKPDLSSASVKCVHLVFEQSGNDITVRATGAGTANYLGKSAGTGTAVVTSDGAVGYGVHDLVLAIGGGEYTLTGANTWTGGFTLDRAALELTASSVRGDVMIANDACLSLLDGGSIPAGTITVKDGGYFFVGKDYAFNDGHKFVADNGMIDLRGGDNRLFASSQNYLLDIRMVNGGRVFGYAAQVGNYNNKAFTLVSEEGAANTMDAGIVFTTKNLRNPVYEVRTDADLAMNGSLRDLSGYPGFSIRKSGAAKLSLGGVNTFSGAFEIAEGTLALTASGALNAMNALTLGGATLDVGVVTNSVDALMVVENSTNVINLASGLLSFADSSSVAWGTGASIELTCTGDRLPRRGLRFGTSAAGLTAEQLACFTYEGKPVVLDKDGYVRPQPSGLVLIFR